MPGARSVERISALCRQDVDERDLRIAILEELGRHVPFDVHAWLLTDPETEVGSAPLANAPSLEDLPRLIRAKYLTATNRWTALAEPVATLLDATGGEREQSRLWREALSAYGVDDVASLVFRDAFGCWGWLDLWRMGEHRAFSAGEVADLRGVVAPITEALRRGQARTFGAEGSAVERAGPVVLVLSPQLEVKAQTPAAEEQLRALMPPEDDRRPVPAGAFNVAAQLLAIEAGVDDHPASARVHVRGGSWMTLRAARVDASDSRDGGDLAVTIEPSSPAERRSLFARGHALSPRESELLDQLAGGADTRTIARQLFLSEYTVQDHLKSIFAKTGTRNRRTLLSRLAGP